MSVVNSAATPFPDTAGTSTGLTTQTPTTTSISTTLTPSPETRGQTTETSSTPVPAPVTIILPPTSGQTPTSTSITSIPGNGTTNTVLEVHSPVTSSGNNGGSGTSTPTPVANANSSATVIINMNSGSGDTDGSSDATRVEVGDQGVKVGPVIGIVIGTVLLVLLIVGLVFFLYRRRKRSRMPQLLSFDSSYNLAPGTLPAADPIMWTSHTPSSDLDDPDGNKFHRTVDLESTGHVDSTSHGEPLAKNKSSLWDDETILAARIPMEKLVRRELISEGGHGAVYHGQYRGEHVAIKMLLLDKRKEMRQINLFLAEIKMMASVEHPRIVRFVGVAWDALSDLCAVSEFMPSGDLFSLLQRFHRVDHRPLGFDKDKAKIAQHIAQALTYLHSLDPIVLHRDLKSMNVLLSEDWDAKLTDFGVSRKWTVDTMTVGVGTRRWMAPEVMMGRHYDTSADIFSLGVVLSELDSHQPPYASAIVSMTSESGTKVTETALAEMVATGRIRIEFSPNAPSALVTLGHACVNLDSRARPSASEVHYQLAKLLRKYQKYTL